MGGHNLARRLDPAHLRHVDVHQDEGRVQPVDELDRLRPARRLARELEALQPAEHGSGGEPERRLVIYDEHRAGGYGGSSPRADTVRAGHGISLARAGAAAHGGAIRTWGVASPRDVTVPLAG